MKIVVLGDIHFPFHSKPALKEVLKRVKAEKPTHVVQIGDLYDQYSFSRFTKRNLLLPEVELKQARSLAETMWSDITKNTRAKCYQILGNHDVRMVKRAEERMPEAQDLIRNSMLELYEFKGVNLVKDDRDILEIGNVAFHHGYLSKLGDHMRYFGKSTVVGHSHTGGVVFKQHLGRILWELNAGYLADESSEPLRYRPTKTSNWTLGFGLIDDQGPRFIPV